ncbi:hypothetical protein [Cysteiniphilum litorale]|uniref:hypothetical protein n=1 Tax=Cysteiniphilum litorale TaxID=2056700 RepID=UPI003F880BB1
MKFKRKVMPVILALSSTFGGGELYAALETEKVGGTIVYKNIHLGAAYDIKTNSILSGGDLKSGKLVYMHSSNDDDFTPLWIETMTRTASYTDLQESKAEEKGSVKNNASLSAGLSIGFHQAQLQSAFEQNSKSLQGQQSTSYNEGYLYTREYKLNIPLVDNIININDSIRENLREAMFTANPGLRNALNKISQAQSELKPVLIAEFKQKYGTHFVSSVTYAAGAFGQVTATATTDQKESDWALSASASYKYNGLINSGSVSASYGHAEAASIKRSDYKMSSNTGTFGNVIGDASALASIESEIKAKIQEVIEGTSDYFKNSFSLEHIEVKAATLPDAIEFDNAGLEKIKEKTEMTNKLKLLIQDSYANEDRLYNIMLRLYEKYKESDAGVPEKEFLQTQILRDRVSAFIDKYNSEYGDVTQYNKLTGSYNDQLNYIIDISALIPNKDGKIFSNDFELYQTQRNEYKEKINNDEKAQAQSKKLYNTPSLEQFFAEQSKPAVLTSLNNDFAQNPILTLSNQEIDEIRAKILTLPIKDFDELFKAYQDKLYHYFNIDQSQRKQLQQLKSNMAQNAVRSESINLTSSDDPLPESGQLAIDFSVTPWEYYFPELTVDPEDLTQSARELAIQKLRDTAAEYIKLTSFIKYNKDYFVSYDEYINDENVLVDGEHPYINMQNLFIDLSHYFAQTGSSNKVRNGEINFKGNSYDLKSLNGNEDANEKGIVDLITALQTHLMALPTRNNPKYTNFYQTYDELNTKGLLNGSGAIFSATSYYGDNTYLFGIKDFAKGKVWEASHIGLLPNPPYNNDVTPPDTYKNTTSLKINTLSFYEIYKLFSKDEQPFYYQISYAIDRDGKVFLRQLPARYGSVTQEIAADLKRSPVKFEAIEDPSGLMPKYRLVIESMDNNKTIAFYNSVKDIYSLYLPKTPSLYHYCSKPFQQWYARYDCPSLDIVSEYPVLLELNKSANNHIGSEIIIAPITRTFFNNAIQEARYITSDQTAYNNVLHTPMRIYFDTQSPF